MEIINSRAFYEYVGDGSIYMTAITDLLDLYKKEKEKNKGLEIKASELNGLAEVVEKYYIHKDKIKEKIEETNNEKLNYSEDEYYLENEVKGYAIDKLKELLEEK